MAGQNRKHPGLTTARALGGGSLEKRQLCYHAAFHRSLRTMVRLIRLTFWALFVATFTLCLEPHEGQAQAPPDSSATTEHSCSFGMAKGDPAHQCQVPIPAGCVIAKFPGTDKPWTTISKAGRTFCTFDQKGTDWKTRITGHCTKCDSGHCTGQFMVRFECAKP